MMSLTHYAHHFQILDLCVIWIYVLYYCDFLLYYASIMPESLDNIYIKVIYLAQIEFFTEYSFNCVHYTYKCIQIQ